MVGNRVLRRTFGPRGEEVAGDWRRLHNEELHKFYTSPNIIWVIKLRRMRWAGLIAGTGDEKCILLDGHCREETTRKI
jgi:hypothetical protein